MVVRSRGRLRDRAISETWVRPMRIEESGVLLADVIEMTEAEAREKIQTPPLDGSDPRFSKGVGVRR